MLTTPQLLTSAAFGLVLACVAPLTGHASEVVIPAAGCTEVAFTPAADSTATTSRNGGGFAVAGGATANLICAVPTDEIDSSSGGDDDDDDDDSGGNRVVFRISLLDGDPTGTGAGVSARLYRTTLTSGATGPVVDTPVCGPNGPTQASFTCPRLIENAFYHLKVSLTSSADYGAAFAGVVAED